MNRIYITAPDELEELRVQLERSLKKSNELSRMFADTADSENSAFGMCSGLRDNIGGVFWNDSCDLFTDAEGIFPHLQNESYKLCDLYDDECFNAKIREINLLNHQMNELSLLLQSYRTALQKAVDYMDNLKQARSCVRSMRHRLETLALEMENADSAFL